MPGTGRLWQRLGPQLQHLYADARTNTDTNAEGTCSDAHPDVTGDCDTSTHVERLSRTQAERVWVAAAWCDVAGANARVPSRIGSFGRKLTVHIVGGKQQ